jgi:hypothetical protein
MAKEGVPGLGVDAQGQPVIDPTKNVSDTVEAAVKRLDDIALLRAYYIEREMELRADFQHQLDAKEAARLDANRSQDQDNARRQAETALAAVQALATQVPITADAVRSASAASLNPIQERLTQIERIQYEQAGQKAGVVETKTDRGANSALVFGAIGALVGVFGFLLGAGSLIFVVVHG